MLNLHHCFRSREYEVASKVIDGEAIIINLANARRRVEQKFWQSHVDGYDALYKELMAKTSHTHPESRL